MDNDDDIQSDTIEKCGMADIDINIVNGNPPGWWTRSTNWPARNGAMSLSQRLVVNYQHLPQELLAPRASLSSSLRLFHNEETTTHMYPGTQPNQGSNEPERFEDMEIDAYREAPTTDSFDDLLPNFSQLQDHDKDSTESLDEFFSITDLSLYELPDSKAVSTEDVTCPLGNMAIALHEMDIDENISGMHRARSNTLDSRQRRHTTS
ncbi:hypothetical protein RvY_02415 [Ramazzottius varieornatus]|uniref:Uncharacterized protein n=1 Tax=Ramazzottius varieornatus TaxID=947166 RepID=A0A1D1UU63_RAMVA|nr:hypothetical protein RvY_02415 [Ramazzottius varieornatus]